MGIKMGTKIAEFRKAKGLTQDQLAEKLGVSAPAVSKWETDSSYPDITMLCPLARALDTNVDTLLQFEENLSDQDVTDKMNKILERALDVGYEAAEKMVYELLHTYPNSITLKFQAAVVWDAFRMFFPSVGKEILNRWNSKKKELLLKVRASGNATYWQTATLQLAGIAISEHDLEQAEQLLKELPEHLTDPTLTWARFYLTKEEPVEALKVVQKRLYVLVSQVLSCLSMMMSPKVTPDPEQALKICDIYRDMGQLFDCGGGMQDGMYLEIYFRMKRFKEAADCLERYVDVITGEAKLPKNFLFLPGLDLKEGQPATTKELRIIMLKSLEEDHEFEELLRYPKAQAAIQKLKSSLEQV